MSSGGAIPYHLRPNKAVERGLFVESLRIIGKYLDIENYRYVGFGGPFMEDFKILHNELKISDMLCLEVEPNVRVRQNFNKPVSCVKLNEETMSSEEFLTQDDFQKSSIVWFDYVSFGEFYTQLSEVRELVSNLASGDVFKVTLNAHIPNLGKSETDRTLQEYRFNKFKKMVTEEYESRKAKVGMMTNKQFPLCMLYSLERAVSYAMFSSELEIVPISNFVYQDGQKMLTVMGVVLEKDKVGDFYSETKIEEWEYFSNGWGEVMNIDLPVLSARERLFVEQMLPDGRYNDIVDKLGYYIGESENESELKMKNFMQLYRAMPWFGKMVL